MRCLLVVLGWLLVPLLAHAQTTPATLIADRVTVEGNTRLVAEGHVEILYNDDRLRASRVTFDQDTGLLEIDGPLIMTSGEDTILIADSASLSPELTDGLLRSARLVLQQQLQLAAAELHRVGGRYSVLEKTVASSCQVCANNPVPLWQLRARRIVHDQQERQIYFDHTRFEVLGVPVFYLPRLRLPDPTLKRATGFLTPSLKFSNELGTGLKVPYFITLGDHADVTLTPYFSTDRTRTLEFRYRQAFRTGEIEFNGAVSRDDLRPGETRSYLFGKGTFDLPRDYVLSFNLESVSDRSYLRDYDYSNKDRLSSSVDISRTRRDEFIIAELIHLRSLRTSENNRTLPTSIAQSTYHRRLYPAAVGGVVDLQLQALGYARTSDGDVIGRDVSRLSGQAAWQRGWTTRAGMQLTAQTELNLDYYAISDDSTFANSITRATPFAAVELRWPFSKTTGTGVTHVLEPVAQLAWSPTESENVPNEDSLSTELDEGNLYALNRFPGRDAFERGLRGNLGLGWTRYDPAGWSLGTTVGRVFYAENLNQFPTGSGLEGTSSDWLAMVQLRTAGNLELTNRAIFDDGLGFTRDELRLSWFNDTFDLSSTYIWQEANIREDRPRDSSEWTFAGSYKFRPNWKAKSNWRYDFIGDRAQRAGLGLQYANECILVDVSLSRRFTSSTNVSPRTDFGLSVSLNGFGSGSDGTTFRRSCARY